MKVRLKQVGKWFVNLAKTLFQFHEGPIKTARLHDYRPQFVFQFHEGPIKTIAFFSKIPLYTRGIIIQRYKNSSRKYVDVE